MKLKTVLAIGTAALLGLAVNTAAFATDRHERETEQAMAEFERQMERLAEEMEQLAEQMESLVDNMDFEAMAEEAEAMAMAALEDSGIRIEEHADGGETVWVEANDHDEDSVSLRVVDRPGQEELVFFYFDGFEQPYSYVVEDDEDSRRGDSSIVHAYDVASVEIVEDDDRHNNFETTVDSRGRPQITIRTDHPERYRVVRLDRSRFDG